MTTRITAHTHTHTAAAAATPQRATTCEGETLGAAELIPAGHVQASCTGGKDASSNKKQTKEASKG